MKKPVNWYVKIVMDNFIYRLITIFQIPTRFQKIASIIGL